MTNFPLLLLSSNLLKFQSPIMVEGGGDDQFPTFLAESKFAEIPKFHYGEGGRGVVMANFKGQLLKLQSKPNFLFPGGWGWGLVTSIFGVDIL